MLSKTIIFSTQMNSFCGLRKKKKSLKKVPVTVPALGRRRRPLESFRLRLLGN